MPQPASCNGKWGPMANRTRENETTAKRFKYRAILKPNCFWEAFRKNPAHFLNRFSAHITAGPAGWHGYKEKERLCQQTSTCSSIYMCRLSIKWPACQFLSWPWKVPEQSLKSLSYLKNHQLFPTFAFEHNHLEIKPLPRNDDIKTGKPYFKNPIINYLYCTAKLHRNDAMKNNGKRCSEKLWYNPRALCKIWILQWAPSNIILKTGRHAGINLPTGFSPESDCFSSPERHMPAMVIIEYEAKMRESVETREKLKRTRNRKTMWLARNLPNWRKVS